MTHQSFNIECFNAFPHLKEIAAVKFDYMGEEKPGSYLIFESVLVPEIEKAASADPAYLVRLMTFVEEVAQPGFGACDDLVRIGLGERLSSILGAETIRSMAGPQTIRTLQQAKRHSAAAERHENWSPLRSLVLRLILPRRKGS